MRLTPEEMRVLAGMRAIKGAGKMTVVRSESGGLSVQTNQQVKPVPPVRQSSTGHTPIHRLRG